GIVMKVTAMARRVRAAVLVGLFSVAAAPAIAGTVELDAEDAGYRLAIYDPGTNPADGFFLGILNPFRQAWAIGYAESAADPVPGNPRESLVEYRSFFQFDVAGQGGDGPIVSATLQLELAGLPNKAQPQPGYSSVDASETIRLVAVTSADDASLSDKWVDLGEGEDFGSLVVTAARMGTVLRFDLNEAGLASLNAAIAAGESWSVGAYNSTIRQASDDPEVQEAEVLISNQFDGEVTNVARPSLVLRTASDVPAFSTTGLAVATLLLGGVGAGLARRRRRD
ncbi:MAG: hypothetical protein AAF517_22575, partial [Planctomycetota bacterium]